MGTVQGAKWKFCGKPNQKVQLAQELGTPVEKRALHSQGVCNLCIGADYEQLSAGALTRQGWSYGVSLGNSVPYPNCITACTQNKYCAAVSYNTDLIPSQNPAAAPLQANTCTMLRQITQSNNNADWNTWIK